MRILLTLFILVIIAGAIGLVWLYSNDEEADVAINTGTPTPVTRTPTDTSTGSPQTSSPTRSPVSTATVTPVAVTPTPGTGGGEEENFIRRGTLEINGLGLKPDTWYLIYDIPGRTGLRAELVLAPDSACTINGETSLCDSIDLDSSLSTGARVRVHGFFESNKVEVTELVVLDASSAPTPTSTTSPTPTPTTPTPTTSPTTTPTPTISPTGSGNVTITTPAQGTLVLGTMIVSASASPSTTKVDFYVDGELKNMDSTAPYTFSWDTLNNGSHPCIGSHTHTLTARAYDSGGALLGESSAVNVNMNNPPYCTTTVTPSPTTSPNISPSPTPTTSPGY
jgi:hypothetical protein